MSEPAAPVTDPAEFEEDDDYVRRVQLGLRPIFYADEDLHPDQQECPSWCWAAGGEYRHEVDPSRPMSAHHSSDSVRTALSYYRGGRDRGGIDGVALATASTALERWSDGATLIKIRTHEEDDKRHFVGQLALTLSLDDARDLVTVLTHLLAQADAAETQTERNAFLLGVDAGQLGYRVEGDRAARPPEPPAATQSCDASRTQGAS